MEYQRGDDNMPGIVEIVELNDQSEVGEIMNDPDYDPDNSARSRGNVVRKRKPAKEKKPRSRSRGRKTRSQSAIEKQSEEILVNWKLLLIKLYEMDFSNT